MSKKEKQNLLAKILKKARGFSKVIGPGVVTGLADNDPSGIGTYSASGAKFGLGQIWLIPFQIPAMIVIQEMCARLGLVTGMGLAGNIKRYFSKNWLYLCVFLLVCSNVFNIGANLAIMASVLNILMSGNVYFWGLFITLVIILLEVFISYKTYSGILKWLTLPFIGYFITAIIIKQDWPEITRALLVPHVELNKDFILLMMGFIGTTISPYLFFWQASEEVEEEVEQGIISELGEKPKRLTKGLFRRMRADTAAGMILSQVTTFFIIITCAATLHRVGIFEINSATDAAMALRPLAGEDSFLLFAVGIIGAGFLGIPVLAGSSAYAISETFSWKEGLSKKFKEANRFYGVIVFATLVGLFINMLNFNPMKTLVYSAVVNGMVAIPLIALIILITRDKKIMGEYVNKPISNVIGWATFSVMLLAGTIMLYFVLI